MPGRVRDLECSEANPWEINRILHLRFKPLVQLDEVETSTGEELEDCLFEWWDVKICA